MLECIEFIENNGGRVIEFSIDPEPITEDRCYTGWARLYNL